jgi:hypothetical protein
VIVFEAKNGCRTKSSLYLAIIHSPIDKRYWAKMGKIHISLEVSLQCKTQVMKSILTILFVLFIGLFAQAQDAKVDVMVATQTETVVSVTPSIETTLNNSETKVVRLYMDRNYKVKKELSFYTKANKSKLA